MSVNDTGNQLNDDARLEAAIRRFDEENAHDPNVELEDGKPHPRELLYAQRLSRWVATLSPQASTELRLAARAQHLCRWIIPRNSYPMDRPSYLRWRNELKKLHAQKAGEILREVGYQEAAIERVQALILKKNFPHDPESRVIEDALCLVFLQYQFSDLAAKTSEDKIVNALQKSWKKMTPQAHEYALKLPFSEKELALIKKALQTGGGPT